MKYEFILIDKICPCIITDTQFQIKNINDLFLKYTQSTKQEIIEKNVFDFFSLYNDIEVVDEFLAHLSEKGSASTTIKLKFNDIIRWAHIHGLARKNEKNINIIDNFILAIVPADAEKELESIQENEIIKNYQRDIRIAQSYMQGLLPNPKLFKRVNPNACLIYRPMRGIGGDWYWFHIEKERTLFLMGDIMGHGINAGIISTMIVSKIHSFKKWESIIEPTELLHLVHKNTHFALRSNSYIHQDFSIDTIACIFYKETRVLLYSSANFPILIQRGSTFLDTNIQKQGIQVKKPWNTQNFTNHSMVLEHKDWVWVFSDGVKDQFDDVHQKPLGIKRFKEMLLQATAEHSEASQIENFLLAKGARADRRYYACRFPNCIIHYLLIWLSSFILKVKIVKTKLKVYMK